ncbi:MAG: DUF6173 family protein [Pseudomonadota bacterium]
MDDKIATAAEAAEAEALPRLYEVHTDETVRNAQDKPLPKGAATPPARKSAAQWAYERIIIYLQNFEEQLDAEHEAAMGFTGSDAGILRIEGMGHFDPDIVTFYGADPTGARVQLIQHVSQLNVMLRAVPKEVKSEAPKRIGFRLARALDEDVT